jgi:hypothetical protein
MSHREDAAPPLPFFILVLNVISNVAQHLVGQPANLF